MREVAQQLTLKRHGAVQALGHAVEGARQLTQLILAPRDLWSEPGRQIARAERSGLTPENRQRCNQQAIQQNGHDYSQHGR